MKQKWFVFIILTLIFALENCVYYVWKKEFSQEKRNDEALILSTLGLIQNPNQEMYFFLPGTSRNLSNDQYVEVTLTKTTSKPKIILVHGWNPLERDADPFTSRMKKIENINGTFSNAIIHYQENQASAKDQFDLYLFTYRTSNGVLANGEGFLSFLNRSFLPSDKVIIIAHSMGGLIVRAAMKSNLYQSGIIDSVITLGSPIFGSPFASKAFLAKSSFVNILSSFLIETQGGADLGYTNNGKNQVQLDEEKNATLDFINAEFLYDSIFINFFGVLNSNCSGAETIYYQTGCNVLTNSTPSFSSNDGIVPANSAIIGGLGLMNFQKNGYDHSMMSMQTQLIDNDKSYLLFREIIVQAKQF